MKGEEAKAKYVRTAEEMFAEIWAWGKGIRSRHLMRWQARQRCDGGS